MTTVAPFVEVLFEVPLEIAKGLASGDMIRRGGVVQWAGGATKGEVVAWLRESGGVRHATSLSAPVMGQLQSLQMATSALAVGQALTLGFSVLSFAVLNHKLTVLDRKLEGLLAGLAELKREVAWLDRRQDIALAARLRGALDQGSWAFGSGRLEALVGVRAVLVEVEQHYAGLLEGMLEARRAHDHAELFGTYQGHLALAAVARTRCEVSLDGAEAGVPSLRSAQTVLLAIDKRFREPLRNVGAHPELLRLGAGAERSLRPAIEAMKETAQRVDGYQTELNYCALRGISMSDWEQLGGDNADGRLALLLPRSERRTT